MIFDLVFLYQTISFIFSVLTGDSEPEPLHDQTLSLLLDEIFDLSTDYSHLHTNKDPNFKLIYNYYIDILKTNTFYGTWSNPHDKDEKRERLIMFNSESPSHDLLIFKNKYMDQEYVAINDLFHFLTDAHFSGHQSFVANKITFQFYTGQNFLEDGSPPKKSHMQTCTIEKFTLEVIHHNMKHYSSPFEGDLLDLRIKIKLEGNECFPTIETSEMKPFDQRIPAEKGNYLTLYKIWIGLHIIFGLWKLFRIRGRRVCDSIQIIQIFLALSISVYVSKWHDLFVKVIKDEVWLFMAGINVLGLIPGLLIIMKSMRRTTFFWRFGTNILILVALQFAFSYSRKTLMATFILIPCLDILRNLVPRMRIGYDLLLYVGLVLPNLLIFEYFMFNEENFARLAPHPELKIFVNPLFLVIYIVLPAQDIIRRIQFAIQRSKKYLSPWSLQPEDSCPICMRVFQESYEDDKLPLNSLSGIKSHLMSKFLALFISHKPCHQSAQREQTTVPPNKTMLKIIKTPCGHIFHEKCLDKWLKTKTQCPYCRESVKEMLTH